MLACTARSVAMALTLRMKHLSNVGARAAPAESNCSNHASDGLRENGARGTASTPLQRRNALDSGSALDACTELESDRAQRCSETARVTAS
jgi:hypothetical protein